MDDGPATRDGPTRAALPRAATRDPWIEQRLSYLAGEQARLKGGVPLKALFKGCRRRLPPLLVHGRPRPPLSLLGDDSHRRAAGLNQRECGGDRPDVTGSAPDGPGPGAAVGGGLNADRAP
jgi:hypothetical protein